jgi:flagellin
MISIQTNVDSLIAQSNLNIDDHFQSNTIQQLTSGYRINRSGDDAAGLAIANSYESQIDELTQGVNNANDGVSQLQIVDGGLSNISTILDRLKTLATESASSTFTGDRSTLNNEYTGLLTEIDRQAANINLGSGDSFNTDLNVFIGGGSDSGNTNTVGINLSGDANAVDATSLGLSGTNVLAGGVGFTNNTVRLDQTGVTFLASSAIETFIFNLNSGGSAQTVDVKVTGTSGGISGSDVLTQLNDALSNYGINASTASNGTLQFSGATAFNVKDNKAGSSTLISGTGTTTANNTSNYVLTSSYAGYTAPSNGYTDILSVQTGSTTQLITLTNSSAANITSAISQINGKTASLGVYAIESQTGGIQFQSANSFSVNETLSSSSQTQGVFNDSTGGTFYSATAPVASTESTNNAISAITAIDTAISNLGLVQGVVGAGENKLQYAINLAQSQITNFSAAESQIKDANVAAEAANLSKSQVLTQTAIAALAQANSEPQAVLKLLQ